ncbi:MAG: hydroxymethylpyrimidine/phosphomethylpyrimidine kinase [Candidatus Aminicenantes bacterium]|nr:hydroxymethylpyrimidine/phosphomethylpyrimidine kinase [Candidatus Aminicenantes bacterium]
MAQPRTLLSIAGFDPSGGAGALVDLGVFRGLGFHGAAALTALTIQNTRRVERVYSLRARQVKEQYEALRRDIPWCGLKVGMLGTQENLRLISRILEENSAVPRVVDPIFQSSSGAWLLERKAVPRFLAAIKGRAAVLTPNLGEASLLTGRPVRSPDDMRRAAAILFQKSGVPCLIKGGHLKGPITDLLYDGRTFRLYRHRRFEAGAHGTGCFLSAALLVFLADGYALDRACGLAIGLSLRAIRQAGRPGRGRPVMTIPF